jgi:hypothetical protein
MGNVNYFCERYEQDLKKLEMSQDSEEEKKNLKKPWMIWPAINLQTL